MAVELVLGTRDATKLLSSATFSGSIRQCARTLSLAVAVSESGTFIPGVDCDPGTHVEFYVDGALKFDGWVIDDAGSSGSWSKTLTCYDRGFYLRRNETVLAVRNQTPEDVTRSLCASFGIACGDIAVTDVRLTRNFLPSSGGANTLYNIIQTLYTLASRETGEKYYIRFEGAKLCVRCRKLREYTLALSPGSNLLTASSSSSIANTVTSVEVYDKNDNLLLTRNDAGLLNAYGLLRSVLKAAEGENPAALAAVELRDNGISQDVSVTNIGNIDCMAGGTVLVRDPSSGLNGVFWIDEDYHYWRKGLYTNKLILNYQALMNEITAGSE